MNTDLQLGLCLSNKEKYYLVDFVYWLSVQVRSCLDRHSSNYSSKYQEPWAREMAEVSPEYAICRSGLVDTWTDIFHCV